MFSEFWHQSNKARLAIIGVYKYLRGVKKNYMAQARRIGQAMDELMDAPGSDPYRPSANFVGFCQTRFYAVVHYLNGDLAGRYPADFAEFRSRKSSVASLPAGMTASPTTTTLEPAGEDIPSPSPTDPPPNTPPTVAQVKRGRKRKGIHASA